MRTSTQRLTATAGLVLATGIGYLAAYLLVAPAFGDGPSPLDAYWIGRLPWIAIAELLIVLGATATVLCGLLAVFVTAGWIRRALALLAIVPVALWWFLALLPWVGAYCPNCAPPTADPFAFAYSLPSQTVQWLVLPAILMAVLALVRPRPAG